MERACTRRQGGCGRTRIGSSRAGSPAVPGRSRITQRQASCLLPLGPRKQTQGLRDVSRTTQGSGCLNSGPPRPRACVVTLAHRLAAIFTPPVLRLPKDIVISHNSYTTSHTHTHGEKERGERTLSRVQRSRRQVCWGWRSDQWLLPQVIPFYFLFFCSTCSSRHQM